MFTWAANTASFMQPTASWLIGSFFNQQSRLLKPPRKTISIASNYPREAKMTFCHYPLQPSLRFQAMQALAVELACSRRFRPSVLQAAHGPKSRWISQTFAPIGFPKSKQSKPLAAILLLPCSAFIPKFPKIFLARSLSKITTAVKSKFQVKICVMQTSNLAYPWSAVST